MDNGKVAVFAGVDGAQLSKKSKKDNLNGAGGSRELLIMPVLGMTCAACQRHVESTLRDVAGVISARVDLMRHRASIEFDPAVTGPVALVGAIQRSGYDAVPPRTQAASGTNSPNVEAHSAAGWKALITILSGATAMLLSMPMGMSAGDASGLDRAFMRRMPRVYSLPREPLGWSLLAVTGVLAVWAGGSIYRSAWTALLHRETNMNTLVSLGTGVAFLYSAWVVGAGAGGNVYFDSVLLILGFLLLGKWLEMRARHRALASVDALASLQPTEARVKRREIGFEEFVESMLPVEQVLVGDLVVILRWTRRAL